MMGKVEVVAEIGTNWDPNDRERTITEAIRQAKEAGADLVKFQDWAPIEQMNRPQEWKDRCDPWTLTWQDKGIIREASEKYDIPWFCSAFTMQAARAMLSSRNPYVKIASSEAANDRLLRHAANNQFFYENGSSRPVVIVSFGEVKDWNRVLLTLATINAHADVIPMGCIAEYPAKITSDHKLWDGHWAKQVVARCGKLGLRTGWSSHVAAEHAPEIAAQMVDKHGVTMVEAHMRIKGLPDSCPDNGDWSLYPDEFAALVQAVRGAE